MLNWLFPAVCILCKANSYRDLNICQGCEAELPWNRHCCRQCALPLATTSINQLCAQCLKTPPPFEATFALCHYQTPIDNLLMSLKFQNKLVYAKLLGSLMAKYLPTWYAGQENFPECIIPVPLHLKRLKARGFNQALELARPIARQLALPINLKGCRRQRNTNAQALTPAKKRQANLKNAFSVTKLKAKRVAIIDDVVTTGHTITALSKALKAYGVQHIDI